jgi:hypothetical protein
MIGPAYDAPIAVIDQIHLTEARAILIPICPSANGDTVFEQRAGLGETTRLTHLEATTLQEPIYGGRTDPHQFFVTSWAHLKKSVAVQSWKFDIAVLDFPEATYGTFGALLFAA